MRCAAADRADIVVYVHDHYDDAHNGDDDDDDAHNGDNDDDIRCSQHVE